MNVHDIRRSRLKELIKDFRPAEIAKRSGIAASVISRLSYDPEKSGSKNMGEKIARKLEESMGKPHLWFDRAGDESQFDYSVLKTEEKSIFLNESTAKYYKKPLSDVIISQYDTGGKMGKGGLVLNEQAGEITTFTVSHDWIKNNIKEYTSLHNLKIVTGFGNSMVGMFNPGDPLLIDAGVKTVEFDSTYFFRVGNEGFIKILQRIPGQGIRVVSKNKDYESWTINENMDFEVLGRVLKVWKSEDF